MVMAEMKIGIHGLEFLTRKKPANKAVNQIMMLRKDKNKIGSLI